ncbi:MAG: ABC transporter ATP-binding protein [Immundisolibacterales bacterium]|nr:ABC transporter ATP-binding protein [Immundisolibacterales bacterium]
MPDRGLFAFTAGVRGRIAFAVAVGLAAALVGIGRFAALGWLIAGVFAGEPLESLAAKFALVGAIMLLRGWLEYWRNMIAHRTAARVQMHLRERLFDKVTELGPAWFGLERTGQVLVSLVEGVEQLETWFGQFLPQLCVAALTPLLVFAFLAFLDIPVALLLLAFALFTLFAPAVFTRWDRENSRRRQRAYSTFAAEFLDTLQGLATLKAFGQSGERGRRLAARAQEVFRTTMWVLAVNSLGRGITDVGLAVGAAVVLGFGAFRVDAGVMSLAELLVVLMMGIEVFRPQRDLRALLHQGLVGMAAADGVLSLLAGRPIVEYASSRESGEVPGESEPMAPTVEFEGVRFAYPGARRPAHRGLDFRIGAGERVGFVGASGAGKTSIVRLLLRLYDPDGGTVRIGGRDLRELPASEVHGRIAVVNQDTVLFHGTVEDNLRFGRPGATHEELAEAARAANAHGFIERLPDGYRTVVGERGVRLSGGQRQRIAIARAILRDAPILVLDEALSAVDAENEAVIQEALERLMAGRTTLVFAHRLSSVIGADRILVLDGGKVVESGRHAELMRASGVYFRLMRGQAEESRAPGDIELAAPAGRPPTEDLAPLFAAGGPTDEITRAEGLGWMGAFRELFRHVRPWRGRLALTFGFGVVRVACLIGVGVLSALAVAALKRGEDFTPWLYALVAAAPAAGILHWLESWVAHDMAFRMLAQMRIDLYRKIDALAPAWLLRRRSGDLVAMATHDVEMVEYFFAHTIAPGLVAVLVPASVLGVLLWFGWPLAAALAPILAVVVLSPFLARHRVDVLGSRAREALADLNAHAVDTIQGLGEIVAFERTPERRREFVALARRHVELRLPFFQSLTIQNVVLETATGLGGLVVVVTGAWLVSNGQLDAALLPLLALLAMASFLPVSEIAYIGRQLSDTLGATRRLYAVHGEPVTVRDGPGVDATGPDPHPAPSGDAAGPAGRPEGADADASPRGLRGTSARPPPAAGPRRAAGDMTLAMEAVDFRYPGREDRALSGVSFEIPAGMRIALVGPSGAGKTTAAHLLLRFFDPEHGSVRLAGHDLREWRLDELRARIALVSQDTWLFNETLRANILVARPEADEAEIVRAVERAALADFASALPEGLDTPVGERGVRLSGGQRQRVAIARAFLKDAPVLVLDEATSHLDAVSEQAVQHALETLMHDRTTVIIAHRLSTVRSAGRIVVMDEGRVVEMGRHDELLRRPGLYSQLVGRQLAAVAD